MKKQSKVNDESYFQIQGWMINSLKLKGLKLSVFAIIFGFSKDGAGKFTGSISYLQAWTGAGRSTCSEALKSLVQEKYVLRKERFRTEGMPNEYFANMRKIENMKGKQNLDTPKKGKQNLYKGQAESGQGGKQNLYKGQAESGHNKYIDKNREIVIAKRAQRTREKKSDLQKEIKEEISERIDRLKNVPPNSAPPPVEQIEEVEALTESESTRRQLKALAATPTMPERMKAFEILGSYSTTQDFRNQWEFMTGIYPQADKMEVLRSWVLADNSWFDVRNFKLNKLAGFIRVSHQTILKNEKNAGKTRKHKNLIGADELTELYFKRKARREQQEREDMEQS